MISTVSAETGADVGGTVQTGMEGVLVSALKGSTLRRNCLFLLVTLWLPSTLTR